MNIATADGTIYLNALFTTITPVENNPSQFIVDGGTDAHTPNCISLGLSSTQEEGMIKVFGFMGELSYVCAATANLLNFYYNSETYHADLYQDNTVMSPVGDIIRTITLMVTLKK